MIVPSGQSPRLLLALSLTLLAGPAWAASSSPDGASRTIVVLIGVKNYNRQNDLKYCDNDVELVANTLKQYCQYVNIIRMTNKSVPKFRPTRGNIISVLRERLPLEMNRGHDRLILFFAGHGKIGKDKRLYLIPQDCAVTDLENTSVSVAEIRSILNEYNGFKAKYLFLDACHSGETRSGGDAIPVQKKVETLLADAKGLFTLAACRSTESSWEWSDQRHGYFTFYFCEALAGAADKAPFGDSNGVVDTKELSEYVSHRVSKKADEKNLNQHPVAIRSKNWQGPFDFVYLREARKNPKLQATVAYQVAEARKYRNGPRYLEAIEHLDNSLEIAPAHPELLALRGQYYMEWADQRIRQIKGVSEDPVRHVAAVEDLTRAISTDAGDSKARVARYHSLRCSTLYKLGRLNEALDDASVVVKLRPSAKALQTRSVIYSKLGKLDLARTDEEAAIRLKTKP